MRPKRMACLTTITIRGDTMSDYLEAYNMALGEVHANPGESMQSVESRVQFHAKLIRESWHDKANNDGVIHQER